MEGEVYSSEEHELEAVGMLILFYFPQVTELSSLPSMII